MDAQETGGTRDATVPTDGQRHGPTRTAAPLGADATNRRPYGGDRHG
ncbi:hypothetical protein ACWDFR_31405 [Streptomyces sp. 900105755]